MESKKFKEKCQKHPDHKIDYMRINNEQGQDQSKPFFCCIYCLKEDDSINVKHYEYIKYLLKSTSQQILRKWPLINKSEIIDKLIEIVNDESQNNSNIIDQIFIFFDNLKKEINEQIDICQKKMIEIAEKLPETTKEEREYEIGIKYQEISKINELKEQLCNNDMKIDEKERIIQDLVIQSQSNETINKLYSLLDEYTPQFKFNTQPAQIIQQQIINSISSISLFQKKKKLNISQNNLNIEFIKSKYKQGDTKLDVQINNNNQPEVTCICNTEWMKLIYSNIILDPNLKYIFRFKFNIQNKGNTIHIGLIQDKNINQDWGGSDELYYRLANTGQCIQNDNYSTRFKLLKGEEFKLQQQEESELEFRISISENIFYILDYPHYKSILSLNDQMKLKNVKQLRFFVGLYQLNDSAILTHSQIVDQFE